MAYKNYKEVDFTNVTWTGGFWKPKFDQLTEKRIPDMEKALHDKNNAAYIPNFFSQAGIKPDKFYGTFWGDGDCYKFLESLSLTYAVTKDPELDKKLDTYIDAIAKAQDESGYISMFPLMNEGCERKMRYKDRMQHEFYNMGHLLTAACIHYRVTGKENFLEVGKKCGRHLADTFLSRPKSLVHMGWNPSQIMGMVELYRLTGEKVFLDTAEVFVEMRGSAHGGSDLNQFRTELVNETTAEGHAVTGPYLWCGAADVVAENNREDFMEALRKIWDNIHERKYYITGGIGALHRGVSKNVDKVVEAFGREWELPNTTAYNETCANIAGAMFSKRMYNLTGESKYMDDVENVIYNVMLASTDLEGTHYFYSNLLRKQQDKPLLWHDSHERWHTSHCYCCPPSVSRTIGKLGSWGYSVGTKELRVNLYGDSEVEVEVPEIGMVKLSQQSRYPWDGRIKLKIEDCPSEEFAISLRIPGWLNESGQKAKITVNDGETKNDVQAGSYFSSINQWKVGDTIEMDLPMEPVFIEGDTYIEEVIGQLAVKRGPLVYCLEQKDLPNEVEVMSTVISRDSDLTVEWDEKLLGGIMKIKAKGKIYKACERKLYKPFSNMKIDAELTLIPYFTWCNRGSTEMTVWMRSE
jgi:DUF1680 family protein